MTKSMTGFGRAEHFTETEKLTVEIKSVNHRFLDIAFRMPRNLMFLEDAARRMIGAKLSRGHVDLFLTYRNLRTDARRVTVDRALFQAYASALDSVADFGMKDDRTLMGIARLPDVMTVSEADEDQAAVEALLAETLDEALSQLVAMRLREGEAMQRDLSGRLDAIERMTGEVEARYPETVTAYTQWVQTLITSAPTSAAPAAAGLAAGEVVKSPMPGNILKINVAQGQQVKEGDVLLILEAMKMENEVVSPKAGTVAQIAVSKGAVVETGTALVVIA